MLVSMFNSFIYNHNELQGAQCEPDQDSYMVWIQLTVASQTVQESLDVWSEDGVKSCVVDFIQMFSQTVPKVKGDLHHLNHRPEHRPGSDSKQTRVSSDKFDHHLTSYCGCPAQISSSSRVLRSPMP